MINDIIHTVAPIGSNQMFVMIMTLGLFAVFCLLCFMLWIKLSDLYYIYKQEAIFIEVTPPREASKTPEATEQLMHNLYGIASTKTFRNKVLRRSVYFSLEIVSSREEGVRYVVRASAAKADTVERAILAFMSTAKLKRIEDPLVPKNDVNKVKEFKQTRHYALPIRVPETYEQHDMIAYIAGAMNRLDKGEQVALQLVISPIKVRGMAKIVHRYHEYYKVSEATHNKAYSQLFRTELRARVISSSDTKVSELISNIEAAIASVNIPKIQTLKARYNFPQAVRGRYREWAFVHRMPAVLRGNSNKFSSLEVACLYHFPANQTSSEGLIKSLSRTLPTPITLKDGTELEVVFGKGDHNDDATPIGLTQLQRSTHTYIIGSTGSGKTTLLKYEILQDIKAGRGVAFLDPHGDAAQELLQYIPEERRDDVVYFNPDDLDYPIGLNLLEISPGLSPNDLLRHKELITEATVSIFRKIFSDDDKGGHRIEYLVRNTVQTALTLPNPTLFTIFELLNDPQFRKDAVASLENKNLQNFWRYEFAKAGDFQQIKMSAGVTNKVGRFLFSASAERIIGQPKSTIDFDDILSSGKILICNLSKGLLGEDTSELFGITILAQLQMATMRRARQPEATRKPFYLYVDEFQNFATPSFVQLLSEARKYKLYLHIAEQSTAQQEDRLMVNTILANVGTVICFRTGSPLDEQLLLPFFDNRIDPGEISNQPAHHFYAKIAAVKPQEPLSGETIQIPDTGSVKIAKQVINASRINYATKYVGKPATNTAKKKRQPKKDDKTDDMGDLSLDDFMGKADF